jgi:hypothetical protein
MAADTVGFIGLGNMGIPMTTRLVAAGYQVRGFDTAAEARQNFEAVGSAGTRGGVTALAELGPVGDGADAVISGGSRASLPTGPRAAGCWSTWRRGPPSSTCHPPTRHGRGCWRNWWPRRG